MTELVELAASEAALTTDEQSDLNELEGVIERGQRTFIEVGQALANIRNDRLYRATHATFEAYLAERWPDMSRRGAYRLIAASDVADDLRTIGHKPTNESQLRPLTGLPTPQRQAAYQSAVEAAGGQQPTAKQVEAAAVPFKLIPLPPPIEVPIASLQTMPPALAIAPKVSGDAQAIVLASTQVAYLGAMQAVAQERLHALLTQAAQAGVPIPTLVIPVETMQSAAHTALESATMKMQIAMLAMAVKVQ